MYVCMYVCMFVCMYVCMYVTIRRPRVHALCACASIIITIEPQFGKNCGNIDRMLTVIVAHPAGELNSSMNSQ